MGSLLDPARSPLVDDSAAPRDTRMRFILFLVWIALVAWLISGHVFWRDEVRAFTLALSGSNVLEMLRNIQGEGHPALWYLLLRGAHEIAPYREVLPAVAAVVGIAAMGVFTFRSPFRTIVIALVLFSFYGAFEYVVVARNYGISALVMFIIAALYDRVRSTLWFGLLLAILCNTNVPSCILAAGFLQFRLLEMIGQRSTTTRRDWLMLGGNVAIAAVGAYICFRTVYPTVNDAAVSTNFGTLTAAKIGAALIDSEKGFWTFGLPHALVILVFCCGLIRRPAAFWTAVTAFFALKLFFYLVYLSYYRHEILFIIFLLALHWMVARGRGEEAFDKPWAKYAQLTGQWVFFAFLFGQSALLVTRAIYDQAMGYPYSRVADLAALLERPELSGAIVMGDPDTMLEPLRYYADNPLWMLRQQRFGHVVRLTNDSRGVLSLDDILADAERLHRSTGRPIVILSYLRFRVVPARPQLVMFGQATLVTPENVRRFQASTRRLAEFGRVGTDESYDVFVYPR